MYSEAYRSFSDDEVDEVIRIDVDQLWGGELSDVDGRLPHLQPLIDPGSTPASCGSAVM